MKSSYLIIAVFLLISPLGLKAELNTIKYESIECSIHPNDEETVSNLSCLSITFTPNVVLCGTSSITALVNCDFTGTVRMNALGNPPGIVIPTNDLLVVNGVFHFDMEVQEGAPSFIDILTTVTATYSDPGNCVLDEVCEPSTIVTNCYVPENNDCSNALEIPVGQNTCSYNNFSNHLWTASGMTGNCSTVNDNDMFFSFEAIHSTTHILFGELPSNSMTMEVFESCYTSDFYCVSMGSYTNITFNDLTPGDSYIIRISDLPGDNQGIIEMCIWSPLVCNLSADAEAIQNEICLDDCQGSATVSLNSGTAPFNYQWSNGDSGETIENLCAGSYIVEATDANGCMARDTAVIAVGMFYSADAGQDAQMCKGDSVQLQASAGNTYRWTPAEGLNNAFIANPVATPEQNMVYSVSIINELGCKGTDEITITVNENPGPSIIGDTLGCSYDSLLLDAGNGYVQYYWNQGDTSQILTAYETGTYAVMVTDTNGCQGKDTTNIQFLSAIDAGYTVTHEYGNDFDNGSIFVEVSGGLAPYQLSWNQGDTSNTLQNLTPGEYSLTITDDWGCTRNDTFTIDSFNCPDFIIDYESMNAGCFGECHGLINILNINQAVAPLSYQWNHGDTSLILDSLCVGNYGINVTDSLNCSVEKVFEIQESPEIVIALNEILHVHAGQSGSIDIHTPEHLSYEWSGPNGFESISEDISGLIAGCYTLVATDTLSGCSRDITYCIQDLTSSDFVQLKNQDFRIFPQPAGDVIHIEWLTNMGIEAEIKIISLDGKLVGKGIKEKNITRVSLPITLLPDGLYLLQIHSEQGLSFRKCLIAR